MWRAGGLRAALITGTLTGVLSCCSAPSTHPADVVSPQQRVAATDVQLVQRAVDSFNAGAGGPVSRQQSALAALLASGQVPVQRACAAATTTLRFEPVYGRFAAAPGWRPAKGTLSGTVYAVPTLIRIYSGDRITGTDLTDLHVAVQDGRASFPALCLS